MKTAFLFLFLFAAHAQAIHSGSEAYILANSATDFRIVRVVSTRGGVRASSCTALALNKNNLLTSSHCVMNLIFDKKIEIQYPEDNGSEQDKVFRISKSDKVKFKVGASPNASQTGGDLVVITIMRGLSREVRKVTVADFAAREDITNKNAFFVVGNGMNEIGGTNAAPGNRKQTVEYVSIMQPTSEDQEKGFPVFMKWKIPDTQGMRQAICIGDSGGPIFVDTGGIIKIFAAISSIIVSDRSEVCSGSGLAVYSQLNLDWISALLK